MASRNFFVVIFLIFVLKSAVCLPEQGIWRKVLNKDVSYFAIWKSMYNNTKVSVSILCNTTGEHKMKLKIGWMLRMTQCGEEYIGGEATTRASTYFVSPATDQFSLGYKKVKFQRSSGGDNFGMKEYTCEEGNVIMLPDDSTKPYEVRKSIIRDKNGQIHQKENHTASASTSSSKSKMEITEAKVENQNPPAAKTNVTHTTGSPAKTKPPTKITIKSRRKRAVEAPKVTVAAIPAGTKPKVTGKSKTLLSPGKKHDKSNVAKTWEDGLYMFIIRMEQPEGKDFKADVTVYMQASYGYLSAMEWPLLPFYGVMCGVYVIYGVMWLVLSACNWRDLLRIQFWIGGVIILGMLEKAVFYAEYQTINSTGQSVRGAVIFAEMVSCGKRTLARMLVVIVSLGFGIVKPRLGPMLHRVIGMGALYFILGSVEGCLRTLRPKSDPSNQALLASIPLAVLDSAICWWVFTSLVQTTRTLRLRRNVVKLSLYRHFTNTLIFAILASVAFMIWSIKMHKFANCLTDWKEIWVDDAYWHMLFSIILMVIMVLWRPTNNNQRYAFSPLQDAADEEDEEPMLNDAFDGMKMRGVKGQANGSPKPREGKPRDAKAKVEDDLKWIEDNIPSSVADSALPSLLDSDEEIMTTKFEMSKME